MEKLTIEKLAPYLPYGVKFYSITNKAKTVLSHGTIQIKEGFGGVNHILTSDKYKIALRPLSMLTEEIEHEGERFVPIEKIGLENDEGNLIALQYQILTGELQYKLMAQLISWGLDVFELIPKKLAIDKNTI